MTGYEIHERDQQLHVSWQLVEIEEGVEPEPNAPIQLILRRLSRGVRGLQQSIHQVPLTRQVMSSEPDAEPELVLVVRFTPEVGDGMGPGDGMAAGAGVPAA